MIHKKVLDVARSNPDASLTEIAESVSGASETFVERVLEQYGDPASSGRRSSPDRQSDTESQATRADGYGSVDQQRPDEGEREDEDTDMGPDAPSERPDPPASDSSDQDGHSADRSDGSDRADPSTDRSDDERQSTTETESTVTPDGRTDGIEQADEPITDPAALTDRQLETLREVHRDPTATQEEIAAVLDVTRATISKRLNDIPGFDWANRRPFVDRLFDEEPRSGQRLEPEQSPSPDVPDFDARFTAIEERLERIETANSDSTFDPELAHKVVHACMDADHISEEEELELLRQLL
jgi:DNA-binding CsgD family transcriptional regulator